MGPFLPDTFGVAISMRIAGALAVGLAIVIPMLIMSRDRHGSHTHCSADGGCGDHMHPVLDLPVVSALIAAAALVAVAVARPRLRRARYRDQPHRA